MFVHVSAKDGTGIDKLLEAILLQAGCWSHARSGLVSGIVVESSIEKGRGAVPCVEARHARGGSHLAGMLAGRVRAAASMARR
jgi:translation initiation factor IF-2